MNIQELTEEEYLSLKEKLHHAHDKVWKITLHDKEAIEEYLSKVIAPLLVGVHFDFNTLKLDNTTYIRANLQVFYSDVVYWIELIDENSQVKEKVVIAFLLEHKSQMPTELQLRLQLSEYAVSIMNRNYDAETDTTIGVIAIVFNQFNKAWTPQSFRSLFKNVSPNIARFFIDFDYLVTNLPALSDELIDAFDKYGILRATFLAMKHVRNKAFLKEHFEDIFLFLEKHPHKIELRDQLIAYLLGNSDISAKDLEDMLKNIFSPIIQKEVMITGTGFIASAARETEIRVRKEERLNAERAVAAAKKAAEEAQLLTKRTTVIHCWYRNIASDAIADIADLPHKDVELLIDAFQKVKTYHQTHKRFNFKTLMQLSGLKETELKLLLNLLTPK